MTDNNLDFHVRQTRNALLSVSDWTQLGDVGLTESQRSAWSAYRQALRDLPAQPDWPEVTFPQEPQ